MNESKSKDVIKLDEKKIENYKVDESKIEKLNPKKSIKFSLWKLLNLEIIGYNKKDSLSILIIIFIFFLLSIIISKFTF